MNDKVKATSGPVVLATDASVGTDRVASGYLATTGHTGLRAHLYPPHIARPGARVVVTELRAVHWGLKAVLAAHSGQGVEVRADSIEALKYLHAWQRGGNEMPEGYSTHLRSQGRTPSLVQLQMVAEYSPRLVFVHEKAHVGNPLNEAADSLAKLGLRCVRGRVAASELPRLVPLWATGALAAYRRAA
ncbi:RNase H family protein [Streptomyces flavidovirens]|uniref:RNase H family protein n=1 Tax=Streptomyces flavidovirens TaxID=67298 RepID=UPI003439778C